MKRSIYALFVLLTALSGPLVLTPPAVSQPKCGSEEFGGVDGGVADERTELQPRCLQEHNQPNCELGQESWAAPEDLVILPEDFGYEMVEDDQPWELEMCEGESAPAASGSFLDANDFDHPEADDWVLEASNGELGHLCLPLAEFDLPVDSWEGPAIAGPEYAPSSEELECELEAARYWAWEERLAEIRSVQFGRWATSRLEHLTYESYTSVASRLQALASTTLSSFQIIDSEEKAAIKRIESAFLDLSELSIDRLTKGFQDYAEIVAVKPLANVELAPPTPPYCDCWAVETLHANSDFCPVPPEEKVLSEEKVLFECEITKDSAVKSVASSASERFQLNPHLVDETEIGANEALVQNDALEQHAASDGPDSEDLQTVDLEHLSAQAIWAVEAALERLETLQRWSKEYEFEPIRGENRPELQFAD
jgi:hypothetical protein